MSGLRRSAAVMLATALFAGGLAVRAPGAPAAETPPAEVVRVFGGSRVQTAIAVAKQAWPDGADAVVLARADDYADALAGGPLAALLDAPILLTSRDSLDPAVAEEIARLGTSQAVVLGGPAALSAAVEDALRAAGVDEVRRLSGQSRFATAGAIAAEVLADVPETERRIYVAEGMHADPRRGWPDALAASAAAAREGAAVLLAAGDALPGPTAEAVRALDPAAAVVAGGPRGVPATAEQELRGLVADTTRVAGADRYATAALLAAGGAKELWLASGGNWPDALVAGAAAVKRGAALLLSDPAELSPATRDWVNRESPDRRVLVGGPSTLSERVRLALATPGADGVYSDRDIDYGGAALWSDPGTWPSGRVPRAGEVAAIPHGARVLLDVSPPALAGLQVDGELRVADRPVSLRAGWIMVHGRFAAGTPGEPLRNRVEIVLEPRAGDNPMGMGAGAFAAMGAGVIDLHGLAPSPSWTRLADIADAGSSTLVLAQPVDWRTGDRIVIASTSTNPDEAEERTVTAVEGSRVSLDQPLRFTHWGRTHDIAGTPVPMHAEVGLLSRRLVVRSPQATDAGGVGGHVMAHQGTTLRVSGAEFERLGQTGVLARYSVHFHMMGDTGRGSYVRDSAIHHSHHRCLTIHGTNHTVVERNVGYQAVGHCFFFEDGTETGNRLTANLGLGTRIAPEGRRVLSTDATPATYWVQHPSNDLVGNAAAGSEGFGFWYDLPKEPTGLSKGSPIRPREAPMGIFDRNVAHSSKRGGPFKTGTGLFVEDYHPPGEAAFRNLVAYGNGAFGAWVDNDADLLVDRAVFAGNNIGFLGRGATLRDSLVAGATPNSAGQPWVMQGVGFYHDRALIERVTFANFNRDGNREHFAIGSIVESHNAAASVRGARFVNVAEESRVLVSPWWSDSPTWTSVFQDLDGSVAGAPATVVSDHALMRRPGCTPRADWDGHVCPLEGQYVTVRFADLTGDDGRGQPPLGPVTVTRADGASGPVHADPDWSDRPLADFTARYGESYRVAFSRPAPRFLELVLPSDGRTRGSLDVSVPWPHATAFVYDGWGEWATPMAAGAAPGPATFTLAGGRLTMRPDTDEHTTWARWVICADRGCGEGIGAKRGG